MDTNINPATAPEQHRFHFLDGLRGVAAIIVVALHPPTEVRRQLTTYRGHLAVDFFFCLSGFVIAFSYERRLRESLPWKNFAVARLIRLYPMIFLGTLLGLIGFALNPLSPNLVHMVLPLWLNIWHAVLSFAILPSVFPARPKDLLYSIDPPMWSLFFEIVANLTFAAMVRLRAASNWVLVPLWAASIALLKSQRIAHGTFDFGYTVEGLTEGFCRVAVSFLAGVLVCRFYRRIQRPCIHGAKAIAIAVLLIIVFLRILLNGNSVPVPEITGLLQICIVFPFIIYMGISLTLPNSAAKLCAALGDISYPLYLIHDPLMWPLYCTSVRSYFAQSAFATPVDIATIAVLTLLAWWVARAYDAPVRKWLSQIYHSLRECSAL